MLVSYGSVEQTLEQEQQSQTATAITIIYDNSGSMSHDGKIEQARAAFLAWLEGQSAQTRFSLIHFSNQGTLAVPLGENTLPEVKRIVASLEARGQTPIVNCLKLAHQTIQKRRESFSPYERHLVVVFTDGGESVDPAGNNGVVRQIQVLTRDEIEVVGIGFYGQGSYMRKASTQYYEAANKEQLKQGLDQVAAEIDPNVEVELNEEEMELLQRMDLSQLESPVQKPLVKKVQEQVASSTKGGFSIGKLIPWIIGAFVIFSIGKKLFD